MIAGPAAVEHAGSAGITLLGQSDRLAPSFLQAGHASAAGVLIDFVVPFLPLFALPIRSHLASPRVPPTACPQAACAPSSSTTNSTTTCTTLIQLTVRVMRARLSTLSGHSSTSTMG